MGSKRNFFLTERMGFWMLNFEIQAIHFPFFTKHSNKQRFFDESI